jgi:hypothetical protein
LQHLPWLVEDRAQWRVIDDAWDESRRSVYIQMRLGIAPAHLPDLSFEEAQRRSQVGQSLLDRLARLNEDGLPHDWGFPGMFLPTAYSGGERAGELIKNELH